MEQVLIDIRNENDYFKKEFKNADTISLEVIMNKLDELIYEKYDKQKEETEELDPYDLYIDRKLESEV